MNGWIARRSYSIIHRHGPLAQWLEQATHNRLVAGSSPAGATKYSKGWREIFGPFAFFGDTSGILSNGSHSDSWLIYDYSWYPDLPTLKFYFSRVQKIDEAGHTLIYIFECRLLRLFQRVCIFDTRIHPAVISAGITIP